MNALTQHLEPETGIISVIFEYWKTTTSQHRYREYGEVDLGDIDQIDTRKELASVYTENSK